ncbi:unnamed protein product [Mytilus coruscus]|uniref:Uncharacterized protein n=1 Tax=Mytilus coruscus TaxID=42192 RepID=A0A6J8A238_MYTCO|nr:unnamed protein product [Mytilus coruscus]
MILITPRTKIELKAFTVTHQQAEERSECVYNEIEESAITETLTLLAFGTQLNNSYLDMLGVKNSLCNTLNSKGHYYSDGYLRPETIAHHQQTNKLLENQGTLLASNNKVAGQENDRHLYEQPVYGGIVRSVGYDRPSSEDVQNQTYVSMFVQNPIYPAKIQLENTNRHSKVATCSSKRWTI